MCRTAHTLFVNRELMRDLSRMNAIVEDKLDHGEAIVFFPEGTSTSGAGVNRFKPSLLQVAAERGMPVYAAVVEYRTDPAIHHRAEVICWWGDMTFGAHFKRLLRMKRFHATLRFIPEPVVANDRKALAEALRTKVVEHFQPNE